MPQDVPAADDASPLGDRGSHHSTVADEFYYNPRGAMALGDDGYDFYGNPRQPMLNLPEPLRQISGYGGGGDGDLRAGSVDPGGMAFSSMDVPPPPLGAGEKYSGYIQFEDGQIDKMYAE